MSEEKRPAPLHGWLYLRTTRFKDPPEVLAALATGWVFIASALLIALGIVATITLAWLIYHLLAAIWSPAGTADEVRNTLIAIGALIGAPFLVWRTWVAHVAARANDEQAKIARESLYTSLFTKAVEQLGAMQEIKEGNTAKTKPNIAVRLGAIYALERIAQDSERDHWPIMETLCSYVRNRAGPAKAMPEDAQRYAGQDQETWPKSDSNPMTWIESLPPPAPDLQAALTVIGRRSLNRRRLEQRMREASKQTTKFRLDLRSSNLSKVTLAGLDFSNAMFDDSALYAAQLERGQFNFSSFGNAKLRFAILENGSFLSCRFSASDMVWVKCYRADFSGSNFSQANLTRIFAFGADFDRSVLSDCTMNHGRFDGADFSDGVFSRNSCHRIYLENAKLDGISISHTEIHTAVGLTASQLSTAEVEDTVALPEDLIGHASIKIRRSNNGPYAEPPPTRSPIEVASSFRNLRKKPLYQRIADASYPPSVTE